MVLRAKWAPSEGEVGNYKKATDDSFAVCHMQTLISYAKNESQEGLLRNGRGPDGWDLRVINRTAS
jgi:hypothetical protein